MTKLARALTGLIGTAVLVQAQVLSPEQSQSARLVFESVQLDGAATAKARETLEAVSPGEYVETFEVAEGGQPFSVRSRIHFRRRQP